MKRFNYLLICFVALIVNLSCSDEDELFLREYPRLQTLPVTDISSSGATFNAEFQLRGDFEIERYGFVWFTSRNGSPSLENGNRVVIDGNVTTSFSENIGILLPPDRKIDVRAFVETSNFIVYGGEVDFDSQGSGGPELFGFTPQSGHLTDTLTVTGANFGTERLSVEVFVDGLKAPDVQFSVDELRVKVPPELANESSTVRVVLTGNSSTFSEPFVLLKPIINSVTPTTANLGGEIVISGANFNPIAGQLVLSYRGADGSEYSAEITAISENSITAELPSVTSSNELQLVIDQNNFQVESEERVILN